MMLTLIPLVCIPVMRGLDPRIHVHCEKSVGEADGLPGQDPMQA